MKDYPHIQRSTGQSFRAFKAHLWDKLDGSNIRVEWSKKRGWYKYGSRTRLLDITDAILGPAVPLFKQTLADPLAKLAVDQRWQHLVVFAEFWGPHSIAGHHNPNDPMQLTLFDICPDKRGIAGPVTFLKLCADLPIPRYLGEVNWTREFVERVWRGEIEGVTLEGVVGKAGERHKLVMAKAKTKAWIETVYSRFGPEEGKKIVES